MRKSLLTHLNRIRGSSFWQAGSVKPTCLQPWRLAAGVLIVLFAIFPGRADDSNSPIVNRTGFLAYQVYGAHRRDIEVAVDFWIERLSERIGHQQKAKTTCFEDLDSLRDALGSKELDIVTLDPLHYFILRDDYELLPTMMGVRNETHRDRFLVLARRDSGIAKVGQLAGKRVLAEKSDNGLLTNFFLEVEILKAGGGGHEEFLSTFKMLDKASEVVLPVFFGQADACVVLDSSFETMVELNPQIGRELVPIAASPELTTGIIFLSGGLSETRKQDITGSALTMHEDPSGQQILQLFRRIRVVRFDAEAIEPVEAMVEQYELLTGKKLLDFLERETHHFSKDPGRS